MVAAACSPVGALEALALRQPVASARGALVFCAPLTLRVRQASW